MLFGFVSGNIVRGQSTERACKVSAMTEGNILSAYRKITTIILFIAQTCSKPTKEKLIN